MATFERGFKSWAEKTAIALRKELGLRPIDPLDPFALAEHMDVAVWTPHNVENLPKESLDQLLNHDKYGWSAVTFSTGERHVIIHNPAHSKGRISSDLMHELAHLIANHAPSNLIYSVDGDMVMRSFNLKEEDEANWLGGCLLLPRPALLYIKKSRMDDIQACRKYVVSEDLLRFRVNVSGVSYQLART